MQENFNQSRSPWRVCPLSVLGKIKAGALCLVPVLSLALSGCVTLETTEERDERIQQSASMQADIAQLKAERQSLVNLLEAMRQENQQTTQTLNQNEAAIGDLGRRLSLVEGQYATANAAYKAKLADLQQALASESQNRVTAITQMQKSVSAEFDRSIGQIQKGLQEIKTQNKAAAAEANNVQGEYVVVKGDTLPNIGKAFKVSPESIKRVNKLKDGNLRAGQHLIIPKK